MPAPNVVAKIISAYKCPEGSLSLLGVSTGIIYEIMQSVIYILCWVWVKGDLYERCVLFIKMIKKHQLLSSPSLASTKCLLNFHLDKPTSLSKIPTSQLGS